MGRSWLRFCLSALVIAVLWMEEDVLASESEETKKGLIGQSAETETTADCLEFPVDLVFLIDGSDSIDRNDFARVKQWILSTVDSFDPMNRTGKLQLDVVQFSEIVREEIHSIIQESSREIKGQVDAIEQMRSGTKTYSALRFVNSNVAPLTRSESYRILITMTDGDASEERDQAAIDTARSTFESMFGVGAGDKIDVSELGDFVHNEDQIIRIDDFEALRGIVEQIVDDSCQKIVQWTKKGTAGGF